MKKIYLSLSILFAAGQVSMAQLTLTKAFNEPVVGNIYNKQQYDSTTVIPKATGSGMNWNFNTLAINSNTEISTYTTTASTPSASIFPNATITEAIGTSGNYTHFKATASTFEYQGIQFPGTVINFSNTGVYYTWPTSFGSSNSDSFGGSTTTGTVTSSITGSITNMGAGTGTVVMPGGLTLSNCLQVKNVLNFTITTGAFSQVNTEIDYIYFHGSTKFPILTVQYQTQTSGTVTTKSYDIYVNKAIVAGINEQQLSSSNFILYPNPANNNVNVSLPNNAIAELMEVVDVNGRVVATTTNANTINLSDVTKGVYFVRISNKEFTLQKPIVLVD